MKTGEAHWETLLRCRAIECQAYVVAAAQVGQHNEHGNKRQSWGHAMAVDPWGKVVAQFGGAGDVGVKPFEIDLDLVQKTRDNMPMHTHRRYDLYTDQPVAGGQSLFSALPHLAYAAAVPIGLFMVASATRVLRARAA
jgi:predicted amidohydrolase